MRRRRKSRRNSRGRINRRRKKKDRNKGWGRRKWRAGDEQHQEEKEEGRGRRVGRRGIRSRIKNSRTVWGESSSSSRRRRKRGSQGRCTVVPQSHNRRRRCKWKLWAMESSSKLVWKHWTQTYTHVCASAGEGREESERSNRHTQRESIKPRGRAWEGPRAELCTDLGLGLRTGAQRRGLALGTLLWLKQAWGAAGQGRGALSLLWESLYGLSVCLLHCFELRHPPGKDAISHRSPSLSETSAQLPMQQVFEART